MSVGTTARRTARRKDPHSTAGYRLRQAGQRYTTNRRALVEVLAKAKRPLSLPDVLDRSSSELPQSTAYRNMKVLERAGVVRRMTTSGDFTRYELAEDLTDHHHHLVCSSCGTVNDFTVSPQLERSLARALDRVAASTGFKAAHHRLDLVGVCRFCP